MIMIMTAIFSPVWPGAEKSTDSRESLSQKDPSGFFCLDTSLNIKTVILNVLTPVSISILSQFQSQYQDSRSDSLYSILDILKSNLVAPTCNLIDLSHFRQRGGQMTWSKLLAKKKSFCRAASIQTLVRQSGQTSTASRSGQSSWVQGDVGLGPYYICTNILILRT